MLEKIRENKALKIVGGIIYYFSLVLVLAILFVVLLQRVSNNNISVGGFRIFGIITQSMVPKYEVGDILLSKTVDVSKIKIGDDVVYIGKKDSFRDKIVTHQVVDIQKNNEGYEFKTKGLANSAEDPIISESQIYGKIIYKVQSLSIINKAISNIYVFYFLIFLPMTILILVKVKEIYFEIKERKEENKEGKNDK